MVFITAGAAVTIPQINVILQRNYEVSAPCLPQHNGVLNRTEEYSTVQYSTVESSTVQYSTLKYSTVQYSIVQCSTVEYSAVLTPDRTVTILGRDLDLRSRRRKGHPGPHPQLDPRGKHGNQE